MVSPHPIVDWLVGLTGTRSLLAALAAAYPNQDPQVRLDGDTYLLRSTRFLEYRDAFDIMNAAGHLLPRLCGPLNLCGNYVGDIHVHSVEWVDAAGRKGGIGGSATFVGHLSSREALGYLTENLGTDGATRAEVLYARSHSNPHLAALFDLAGAHPLSWADLYVVYEILEDAVGGPRKLARFAGVSSKALERFRVAANLTRHPRLKGHPEPRMSHHDGLLLIRKLVQAWLDSHH